MDNEKRLIREAMYQSRRIERAQKQAEKHIRRTAAWIVIMNDALGELHKINEELYRHDHSD